MFFWLPNENHDICMHQALVHKTIMFLLPKQTHNIFMQQSLIAQHIYETSLSAYSYHEFASTPNPHILVHQAVVHKTIMVVRPQQKS